MNTMTARHGVSWNPAPFGAGLLLGALIASLLNLTAALTPSATVFLQVIDARSGAPILADVTVRTEPEGDDRSGDGMQQFWQVDHLVFDAPVGASATWVLVEAIGFQDWEIGLRGLEPGQRVGGPVRLVERSGP